MPSTRLSSRLVYENRWLRLREDQVRRQDGSEGIYSVMERAEFAVICPVQDGMVHLVEQFRYPVGRRLLGIPDGQLGVPRRCRSPRSRGGGTAGGDRLARRGR